jgi:hypothetical protein
MRSTYVGKYIDSGSRNGFYHIVGSNRQCGFKEFENVESANWSYRVQTELSKVSAAPLVYSQVGRIRLDNGKLSRWGYITEVASKVRYCNKNNCCCDIFNYDPNCKNYKRIAELIDIMYDMGLDFHDGHIANFGMVKRNSKKIIVLIDTGAEGFRDYDETIWGRSGVSDSYNSCDCSECVRYRYNYA